MKEIKSIQVTKEKFTDAVLFVGVYGTVTTSGIKISQPSVAVDQMAHYGEWIVKDEQSGKIEVCDQIQYDNYIRAQENKSAAGPVEVSEQPTEEPSVLKYRKKAVVIDAMLFKTNNEAGDKNMNAIVKWITDNGHTARHDSTDIYIKTLEGEMRADCGDYVIKGIQGEFYPCKPDIFAKTYEIVEETNLPPDNLDVTDAILEEREKTISMIQDCFNSKKYMIILEKDGIYLQLRGMILTPSIMLVRFEPELVKEQPAPDQPIKEQNPMDEISNEDLMVMAHSELSMLCKTGGRSIHMTVPPRTDDTDMVFAEILKRFEDFITV